MEDLNIAIMLIHTITRRDSPGHAGVVEDLDIATTLILRITRRDSPGHAGVVEDIDITTLLILRITTRDSPGHAGVVEDVAGGGHDGQEVGRRVLVQVVLHHLDEDAELLVAVGGHVAVDVGGDLGQGGRGGAAGRDGRHDHLHRVLRQLHYWGRKPKR